MCSRQPWKPLLFVFAVVAAGAAVSDAQSIPVVPSPRLNDISMVTSNGRGRHVVYYNPSVSRAAGRNVHSFFMKHELAHVKLGHFRRRTDVRTAEYEADVLAAKLATPAEARAAANYLRRGGASQILTHGTGRQRARRILRSARR